MAAEQPTFRWHRLVMIGINSTTLISCETIVVSQKMWSYCLCPYCKCVCNVLSGTLIVLQILAVPISIVEVFCPLLPIVFWLVWNYSGFLLFPKYSPINTKTGFRSFLNHPCLSLTMSYHVLPCLTMSYHVLPTFPASWYGPEGPVSPSSFPLHTSSDQLSGDRLGWPWEILGISMICKCTVKTCHFLWLIFPQGIVKNVHSHRDSQGLMTGWL